MDRSSEDTADFELPSDTPELFRTEPAEVTVDFGAVSDIGKVRTNNEDQYAIIRRCRTQCVLKTSMPGDDVPALFDSAYLLIVADGMGGAAFGELASRLAMQSLWESARTASSWMMRLPKVSSEEIQRRFEAYAKAIHQSLIDRSNEEPETAGMGTTLTSAYTLGRNAIIGHVGDSRVYHLTDQRIQQVTSDHTLGQKLKAQGAGPEQVRRQRHILTNCFAADGKGPAIDIHHVLISDGDHLLLCTDGLSNLVSDDEMAAIVYSISSPQDACQELVKLALDRGGTDNVTVVLAKFGVENE